ncbi:hypothetical protein [Micromonospora sp. KC213]|uniref:hypothetical protein n=1 Tax=Micromonospora sp. KC213 TaxID=2530378 RepID=UPI0010434F7D|nr:hypothetical protein [Micromonospora sp. KC213]TDC42235.1 hypothetical protein E1166_08650 [Micromonospora sp. KC213]
MSRSGGIRVWLRERRAEGVLRILERAPDRAAALVRVRASIDDHVLEGMLALSFLAQKRGDDTDRLTWADLAVEASLHGGTSRGRADALLWHARMYLNHWPEELRDRITSLAAAGRTIQMALKILEEIGPPDMVIVALSLRAQIHAAQGKSDDALQDHLTATRMALAGTHDDQLATAARLLARQYWRISGDGEREAATNLLALADQLQSRLGDGPTSAALYTALGDAHRVLGDEQAAVSTWATARRLCTEAGDPAGVFEVDGHLFEYAVERGQYEEALALGQRCLANAPADTAPKTFARHYHLLGAVLRALGRVEEALAAYDRAIEVAVANPGAAPAPSYHLDRAFYAIDLGHHAQALEHLMAARASPARRFEWLANLTIAELQLSHLGDLAAAVRYSDVALDIAVREAHSTAIDTMRDRNFLACSLHRSGIAAFSAGDFESAYRRFRALLPLLAENLSTPLLTITPTYAHPLTPPPRTASTWWAYLTCRQTGRREEAAAHLARYAELVAAGDAPSTPLLDQLDEAETAELRPILDASAAFHKGMMLARTAPQEALDKLRAAALVLTTPAVPEALVAQLHTAIGDCCRQLGHLADAKAAYQRALAQLDSSDARSEAQFHCWAGLASIAIAEGDLHLAEGYMSWCVQFSERWRTSFATVDERMKFLSNQLPIYEQLVAVRIKLGRPLEAYAAAQLIKSRTLGELLGEPEHRPIDLTLDADFCAVERQREDWIDAMLCPKDADRNYLDLLLAEKGRRDRQAAAAKARRERGLFDGFTGREPPLPYLAIRALLTR